MHQGEREQDAVLLAQAAELLEVLLLREEWPTDAPLPRAEAAYQMGLARATLGDDAEASRWFAACRAKVASS